MTWGNDPRVVEPVVGMMMSSRQAVVDYMTPLGLAHLMGDRTTITARRRGSPTSSGRSGTRAITIARMRAASGSTGRRRAAMRWRNMRPQVAARFAEPAHCRRRLSAVVPPCPVGHAPRYGAHRLGRARPALFARGRQVAAMQREWQRLRPFVDPQRHAEVAAFLVVQHQEAKWWRDACIAYFQSVSRRPLPPGIEPPRAPAVLLQGAALPLCARSAPIGQKKGAPPNFGRAPKRS